MAVEVLEILSAEDSRDDPQTMQVSRLIEILQDGLLRMPEEVRATAFVRLDCYGDYSSASFDLWRHNTAEEDAHDAAAKAESDAMYAAWARRRERGRI